MRSSGLRERCRPGNAEGTHVPRWICAPPGQGLPRDLAHACIPIQTVYGRLKNRALHNLRLVPLSRMSGSRAANDDAAMLRAARTDPEAFGAFYRQWAPALHAWLRTQL